MGIIHSGSAAATPLLVDPAFGAARVSARPLDTLGWNSISAASGNLTVVAANAPVFSFRNISSNPIMLRQVGIGFLLSTAFTAAQAVGFGLMIARNFTASDTGGTALAFTGSNGKHRTSLATPTSLDVRHATTAALGAGTRTLDANYLSMQLGWAGAVGSVITPALNNLLLRDTGNYPIILAQNEGFVVANTILMGAAGVGQMVFNIEFAELSPTGF